MTDTRNPALGTICGRPVDESYCMLLPGHQGLHDSTPEFARRCPEHPVQIMRRIGRNAWSCPECLQEGEHP